MASFRGRGKVAESVLAPNDSQSAVPRLQSVIPLTATPCHYQIFALPLESKKADNTEDKAAEQSKVKLDKVDETDDKAERAKVNTGKKPEEPKKEDAKKTFSKDKDDKEDEPDGDPEKPNNATLIFLSALVGIGLYAVVGEVARARVVVVGRRVRGHWLARRALFGRRSCVHPSLPYLMPLRTSPDL